MERTARRLNILFLVLVTLQMFHGDSQADKSKVVGGERRDKTYFRCPIVARGVGRRSRP